MNMALESIYVMFFVLLDALAVPQVIIPVLFSTSSSIIGMRNIVCVWRWWFPIKYIYTFRVLQDVYAAFGEIVCRLGQFTMRNECNGRAIPPALWVVPSYRLLYFPKGYEPSAHALNPT
jgi:hypothetical protein